MSSSSSSHQSSRNVGQKTRYDSDTEFDLYSQQTSRQHQYNNAKRGCFRYEISDDGKLIQVNNSEKKTRRSCPFINNHDESFVCQKQVESDEFKYCREHFFIILMAGSINRINTIHKFMQSMKCPDFILTKQLVDIFDEQITSLHKNSKSLDKFWAEMSQIYFHKTQRFNQINHNNQIEIKNLKHTHREQIEIIQHENNSMKKSISEFKNGRDTFQKYYEQLEQVCASQQMSCKLQAETIVNQTSTINEQSSIIDEQNKKIAEQHSQITLLHLSMKQVHDFAYYYQHAYQQMCVDKLTTSTTMDSSSIDKSIITALQQQLKTLSNENKSLHAEIKNKSSSS